jgi:hypothetical protein
MKEYEERAKEAARQLAETAVSTPGVFPEYSSWMEAKRALRAAEKRLEYAETVWFERMAPIMDDPDWASIARKKGLIP